MHAGNTCGTRTDNQTCLAGLCHANQVNFRARALGHALMSAAAQALWHCYCLCVQEGYGLQYVAVTGVLAHAAIPKVSQLLVTTNQVSWNGCMTMLAIDH